MPAIVKRSGQVAGSSARELAARSVKSTLGDTAVQPRSRLPCTLAAVASIACPASLTAEGRGQWNVPPVQCSRPSMVVRFSATRPVEAEAVDQPDRAVDECLAEVQRDSVGVAQLRSPGAQAAQRGPGQGDGTARRPEVVQVDVALDGQAGPLTSAPSSGCVIRPCRARAPWLTAPASRRVPSMAASLSSRRKARISALVRSSAVRPGARSTQPAPMEKRLMSDIDMSIPPVTSDRPARVSSAPTDSRDAFSAASSTGAAA